MSRQFQVVAILIGAVFFLSGMIANGDPQRSKNFAIHRIEKTNLCRYTEGPYAGRVSWIGGAPPSDYPVAVGSRCTDGHGSFGIAIATLGCGECLGSAVAGDVTPDAYFRAQHAAKHHAKRYAKRVAGRPTGRGATTTVTPVPPLPKPKSSGTTAPPPPTTTVTPVAVPPEIHPGLAAFRKPPPMEVGLIYPIVFVAGPNEEEISEETEGAPLTPRRKIFVGPFMRVSLLQDPNFRTTPRTDAFQETGADLTTTWEWNVQPLTDGDHILTARVELLRPKPPGGYSVYDSYTRDVSIHISVGTWGAFIVALRNATSAAELFGTLFRSLGKTLGSLSLLISAAFGVIWAIRKGIKRWRLAH